MIPIWESGRTIKCGGMESISGAMATSMKENGQEVSKMGKEPTTSLMRMFTQACTKMEGLMATDSTNGSQEPALLENSSKA
jgi:hypothetical protein